MLTKWHEEPVFPIVLLSLLFDGSIDGWMDGWMRMVRKKKEVFRLLPTLVFFFFWDSHFTGRLRGHHVRNARVEIVFWRRMERIRPLRSDGVVSTTVLPIEYKLLLSLLPTPTTIPVTSSSIVERVSSSHTLPPTRPHINHRTNAKIIINNRGDSI